MDEATQYQNEWQQAQQRYVAGVNAGYSDTDADQMYLAPVRQKWDILKTLPPSMHSKAANDLDSAHIAFLQGIQAGYQPQQSADLYLKPKVQEWQGAAGLPAEKIPKTAEQVKEWYAQNPAMQQEESQAQDQIDQGVPITTAIQGHPMLLKAPGYAQVWRPEYESAVRRQETQQDKEAQAQTPDAMVRNLFRLQAGNKNLDPKSPIKPFIEGQIGNIEQSLTNGPATTDRYVPTPPPELSDADLVAQQHPEWTPDQVKLGTEGKLKGVITVPEVGEIRKGYRFKGGSPALKSNWEPVQ